MRAVALVLCLTFTAGGIGMLAVSSTQADCDQDVGLGMPKQDCKSKAGLISGVGLTMILLGMVGFAATVTTAVDDSANGGPPAKPSSSQTSVTTPMPPMAAAPGFGF